MIMIMIYHDNNIYLSNDNDDNNSNDNNDIS